MISVFGMRDLFCGINCSLVSQVATSALLTPAQHRVVAADGPMFTAGRYEATVGEEVPEGTPVVRVEAASPSGEPVLYTIVGGNTDQLFSIDFATGEMIPIDFFLHICYQDTLLPF